MEKDGTAPYSLGQFAEVEVALIRALPKALEGTDPKRLISAINKKGEPLGQGMGRLLRSLVDPVAAVFSVVVKGDATASELVKRGNYAWSNDWITDEHFPIGKHASVERMIELVEFDRDPTSEEVLEKLRRRKLERPTYEDALYFGIQHPEEQRKRPIVFLHETVRDPLGSADVLVLDEVNGDRGLYLLWFGRRWDQVYLFAGVRK